MPSLSDLPPDASQLVRQPRFAVLATLRRDGSPATTPCWYDVEDGRLLITMYADARRLANIRRDPRVALTILGEDPYQHVSISGSVVKTWEDPELNVLDRLSLRYTGEPWGERKPCVSALVEIVRWHSYGILSDGADHGPG